MFETLVTSFRLHVGSLSVALDWADSSDVDAGERFKLCVIVHTASAYWADQFLVGHSLKIRSGFFNSGVH
ncbi:MAG TPA: hypothetical protein VJZ32_06795 [Candidatus Bathyarchaeia archaeon]|nr:hypothetical protein [Candidatus Bathyarchaeia archaeon]